MSSVTTLNTVVQQGGNVQEMQPPKQQHPEHTQIDISQHQLEKQVEKRLTVQEAGEEGRIQENKRNRGRHFVMSKKKKKRNAAAEEELKDTGRLLDTVA
jgi:hypothetical protein